MLGFVRHFIPHRGNPIGVDLGTRSLRLAQVDASEGELRLIHAARIDAPEAVWHDEAACSRFIVQSLRDALRSGAFKGRRVTVALPSPLVQVKHLRLPALEPAEAAIEVRQQTAAQLGGDADDWFVRHVAADEVYGEQPPQQEIVAFATPAHFIAQLIDDAAAARVDLAGIQVQARVLVEAFGQFYRRKADADAVNLFVDLGASSTRAIVAAPVDIRFVRAMPVSVDQTHADIAAALRMDPIATSILRRSTIAQQTGRSNELPASAPTPSDAQAQLQDATARYAARFSDELDLCRRYYESTCPAHPITRLIFVGGGARDRLLCAAIARAMSLPAQIGDPLVRFNRSAIPALDCIDRREPQPEWTVAIGLSLFGQTVAAA